MRNISSLHNLMFAGVFATLSACSTSDPAQEIENINADYTGNEVVYALYSGSDFNMSGTATFKERKDNATDVLIKLDGTTGSNVQFPVHLHLGDVTTEDADIAALLMPLSDKHGESKTTLKQLADNTSVTYSQLKSLNASIKIHFSEVGEERNIILAAGNIGVATGNNAAGRQSIGVCKSN